MTQSGTSRHDRSLVDGHGAFGVVRDDGVSGLVVSRDHFVSLVYLGTPALRA